jgi:hypothetical protein
LGGKTMTPACPIAGQAKNVLVGLSPSLFYNWNGG